MKLRYAAVALALLACFCGQPEKQPPSKTSIAARFSPPPIDDRLERENLLNIARGSSVVSRTGEMTLQHSAIRLIDGDPSSPWISPPEDPEQSIVISLPARAAIEKLGVQTTSEKTQASRTVRIDVSLDGRDFASAATITTTASDEVLWATPSPVDAAFLRVTSLDGNGRFVQINSVHAKGRITEEIRPRDISGCWTINGMNARFERRGARVSGVIEDRVPMFLEGGTDGRIVRLSWIKGPQFGVVAITLSPDSRTLSGMKWHEVAVSDFFGEGWYGEKAACSSSTPLSRDVHRLLLGRRGPVPLYGLAFDERGNLDVTASEAALRLLLPVLTTPVKLVAREFRAKSDEENLALSKAKIESLRAELQKRKIDLEKLTFEAAGAKTSQARPLIEIARDLYSVVALEKP